MRDDKITWTKSTFHRLPENHKRHASDASNGRRLIFFAFYKQDAMDEYRQLLCISVNNTNMHCKIVISAKMKMATC